MNKLSPTSHPSFNDLWDIPKFWLQYKNKLPALHRKIFPKKGTRVKIDDLGDAFPETQNICEPFETGNADDINRAYEEAAKAAGILRTQGASQQEIFAATGSAYMDARKKAELSKVQTLVDMAREEMEAGRSIAIFCNFTRSREEIMKALKTPCTIHGQQSTAERERHIEDFQQDRQRVIVCNISAGGVGVSLHDVNGKHPRTSIILPSPKAVDMKQALGRIHRAGAKSKARQIIFFAAGTVEEQICERVRERLENIDRLNNGDMNPKKTF